MTTCFKCLIQRKGELEVAYGRSTHTHTLPQFKQSKDMEDSPWKN